MPGSVGADALVRDPPLLGGILEQGGNIPLGVGETVGAFEAVVGLDTLDVNTQASVPLNQLFEGISRETVDCSG